MNKNTIVDRSNLLQKSALAKLKLRLLRKTFNIFICDILVDHFLLDEKAFFRPYWGPLPFAHYFRVYITFPSNGKLSFPANRHVYDNNVSFFSARERTYLSNINRSNRFDKTFFQHFSFKTRFRNHNSERQWTSRMKNLNG